MKLLDQEREFILEALSHDRVFDSLTSSGSISDKELQTLVDAFEKYECPPEEVICTQGVTFWVIC